jgi:hypothetical protein
LAYWGNLIGILISKLGGLRDSLAVTIQALKIEPVMIKIGKKVNGYDMNSTPKPSILLDKV